MSNNAQYLSSKWKLLLIIVLIAWIISSLILCLITDKLALSIIYGGTITICAFVIFLMAATIND